MNVIIFYHQGRVGSTALMDILKQDGRWIVLGEIASGKPFKRYLVSVLILIIGIKNLCILLKALFPNKNVAFELKRHQLWFDDVKFGIQIKKVCNSGFYQVLLKRDNFERLRSEFRAITSGVYNSKIHQKFSGDNPLPLMMKYNGRTFSVDEHVSLLSDEDKFISDQLTFLRNTKIISYENDLLDDIVNGIDILNNSFSLCIKKNQTRIRKIRK